MKKLLFSSFILLFWITSTYASTCDYPYNLLDTSGGTWDLSSTISDWRCLGTGSGNGYDVLGAYSLSDYEVLAGSGYKNVSSADGVAQMRIRYFTINVYNTDNPKNASTLESRYAIYVVLTDDSSTYNVCEGSTVPDSDGDGIPDDQDYYPDDEAPVLVKPIGQLLDDNGNVIATQWKTEKGDIYWTGDVPVEGIDPFSDNYQYLLEQPWTIPSGVIDDSDFPDMSDNSTVNLGESPSTNQDPNMQEGESHDDNDSDSASTGKIVDNTGRTADNTKRIGDYSQELINQVKKLRIQQGQKDDVKVTVKPANVSINAGGDTVVAEMQSEAQSNNQEAQTASNNLSGLDVESYYGANKFSGALTEGEDYQPAEGLGEQTWLTTFIDSNPYKTALDRSGFECANAVCEMNLQLDKLGGSYKLSICEFDDQFRVAGNLLLGLTTLAGLIMVVRG